MSNPRFVVHWKDGTFSAFNEVLYYEDFEKFIALICLFPNGHWLSGSIDKSEVDRIIVHGELKWEQ